MENIYNIRLEQIREIMRENLWDAVIISGTDPHGSEYPALRWKQVQWATGFGGEAGDIVITQDHAGLWTDTRYFIEAGNMLANTDYVLHKTRVPEQVPIPQWLSEEAFPDRDNIVVAFDGLCRSIGAVSDIEKAFRRAGRLPGDENFGYTLVDCPDFLDSLWADRPLIPEGPVITLSDDMAGEDRLSKITALRLEASKSLADSILLTSLDQIAWLLNVRGSDVAYNPIVISYLLVTSDSVKWFVRKSTDGTDYDTSLTYKALSRDGVEILPYDGIYDALRNLESERLMVDPSSLNYHIFDVLQSSAHSFELLSAQSPVALMKSVKNEVEIALMRKAHLVDGVAMEKFLYYLEASLSGGETITERDAADRLSELRGEADGYMGDSFETISAYGMGAALPHYVTPDECAPVLCRHGLYLCDSGAQYLYGTTDITRTVPLGECTGLEREDYTLVLKGHIDLAMAVFPAGTAGCQIDALAREPLWRTMRNFGHGTGHGVGFFLNVHEGPQDIRQNFNSQPLLPGMITSNEPGIYREGQHGVRHENLLLCKEAGENEFGHWLCFETLTLCHFDTSIIVRELLSDEEITWLNDYNARVFDTLSPYLSPQESVWLKSKTAAI